MKIIKGNQPEEQGNEIKQEQLEVQLQPLPAPPQLKRRPGSEKNPSFDHMNVSFTRSNRGNNLLTIDGKKYTLNRRLKDACYWECVKLRCKYVKCTARVVTKLDRISALRGHHNHP
ncbi:uncharacterized protein Dwil_GK28010 [Drosophila willistoni]|uniref:FLYWCH-type domain-containing protein n=1 Tax=Drosophila willistoni TaxID=7260 RepID=A0A0Q9WXP0_DROWI|nr:uncharacterized protein Dwil_GK28010 [Drosophila willistoni]